MNREASKSSLLTSSDSEPLLKSPATQNVRNHGAIVPVEEIEGGLASSNFPAPNAVVFDDDSVSETECQTSTSILKILPALLLGVILGAMDNTIVSSTYPKIGADFNKFNEVSWTSTSYMISSTAFQPLFGRFCDIYGRKTSLLAAYTIFGLGCLYCSLSPSLGHLICARALAGIGGGGMSSTVTILLSDLVPLKERGTYQGIVNVFFAAGSSLGGPVGGYFADRYTWRLGFFIQVPLLAIAFTTVSVCLHLPHQQVKESFVEKFRRVDWSGTALLVAGVSTLTTALTLGGNVYPWSDKIVLSLLASSVIFYAIFGLNEAFYAAEPLAPIPVLSERTCLASYLSNFFQFLGQLSLSYTLPLYFQAIMNESTSKSGFRLIPLIVGSSIGSLMGGIVINITGRYKYITVGSYALSWVAMIVMTTFSDKPAEVSYNTAPFLSGFGNGMGVTTTLIAIIHSAACESQASAIATSYLFRSTGSVLGVSVSTSIIQTGLSLILMKKLGPSTAEPLLDHLKEDITYIHRISEELQPVVLHALLVCIRLAFAFGSLMYFCATVSALVIRNRKITA